MDNGPKTDIQYAIDRVDRLASELATANAYLEITRRETHQCRVELAAAKEELTRARPLVEKWNGKMQELFEAGREIERLKKRLAKKK